MEREFHEVLKKVMKVAPKELKDYLVNSVPFWAPEARWLNLSRAVNRMVRASSNDRKAIALYAILCDCSKREMKRRFKRDGV